MTDNEIAGFLPTHAQMLGDFVRAFRLDEPPGDGRLAPRELHERRARDYFKGVRVKPETEHIIRTAASHAVVASGLMPGMNQIASGRAEVARLVERAIHSLLSYYDYLAVNLQASPERLAKPSGGVEAICRLLVIDLSIHYGSLIALGALPEPQPGLPYWADPNCMKLMVEDALKPWPSASEFARDVHVDPSTVTRWRKGRQAVLPDGYHAIARAIAERAAKESVSKGEPVDCEHIDAHSRQVHETYLRAHGLNALCRRLSAAIGEDAARADVALLNALSTTVGKYLSDGRAWEGEDEECKVPWLMGAAVGGVWWEGARDLARVLAHNTKAPILQGDLLAVAGGNEIERVRQYVLAYPAAEGMAAGDSERSTALQFLLGPSELLERFWEAFSRAQPELAADPGLEATVCVVRAAACYSQGDYESAARLYARAAELEPSPENTYSHGLALSRSGSLDQGVDKLMEAAGRVGDWPDPYVDAALFLLEAKRPNEARTLLESALDALEGRPARLISVLGTCLKETGDPEGALKAYEEALALEPYDPAALDDAAECCLLLADATDDALLTRELKLKCNEFMKQAREQGMPRMHDRRLREFDRKAGRMKHHRGGTEE